MFEPERIAQLRAQGYCTAAISLRLGLPAEYVREVVARDAARQALRDLQPDAAAKARREAAEAKRAKALRLLAEANADLG